MALSRCRLSPNGKRRKACRHSAYLDSSLENVSKCGAVSRWALATRLLSARQNTHRCAANRVVRRAVLEGLLVKPCVRCRRTQIAANSTLLKQPLFIQDRVLSPNSRPLLHLPVPQRVPRNTRRCAARPAAPRAVLSERHARRSV